MVTVCSYCNSILHDRKHCPRWIHDRKDIYIRESLKFKELKLCTKCGTLHGFNWCNKDVTFCCNCNRTGHMTGSSNCPIIKVFFITITTMRDQIFENNSFVTSETSNNISKCTNANWSKIASDLKHLSNLLEKVNLFGSLKRNWNSKKNFLWNTTNLMNLIKKNLSKKKVH